jgi:hypothetical protein
LVVAQRLVDAECARLAGFCDIDLDSFEGLMRTTLDSAIPPPCPTMSSSGFE